MFRTHRFRDKVSEETSDRIDALRQGASDLYEEGRVRARRAEKKARHYVKERPVAALLAAFGLGALAGILLKRR